MVIKNATFITSAASPSQFLRFEKPTIAVVGKSNVGKSSFINMLAGQKKLARTSDTPGRTRLADLPGYGYAKVSKEEKERWGKVMEQFFADRSNADYVFSLVDIRHDPTADDVTMVNYLHQTAYPFTFIATKADKVSRMAVKENAKAIARFFRVTDDKVIAVSSETRLGKEKVLSLLDDVVAKAAMFRASRKAEEEEVRV